MKGRSRFKDQIYPPKRGICFNKSYPSSFIGISLIERLIKASSFGRKKCHVTQRGEGVAEMSPNVTRGEGGGSK